MKAVILAGGKGSRLFPLTVVTPKPLIMIRGRPVIQYIIDHITRAGISEIVLCVSDTHSEHFRNALGNGNKMGVSIVYSRAPEELATSGRILRCARLLDGEEFLIYYADILTNLPIRDLLSLHRLAKDSLCTVAVSDNKVLEFGAVRTNPDKNKVEQFLEKPTIGQISSYKVNVGIAVCRPGILNFCQDHLDLFGDVIPQLLQHGIGVAFRLFEEPFVDIGTIAALEKADDLVKNLEQTS